MSGAVGDALRSLDALVPPLAFLMFAVPLAAALGHLGVFDAAAARIDRSRHLELGCWVGGALVTTFLNLDAAVVLLTPLYARIARRHGLDPLGLASQPVLLALCASSALPVSNLTNLLAVGEGTDDDGICCVRRGLVRNAELVPGGVHVDGFFGVGARGGGTPAVGGTTTFFVDGGAVYIQDTGRYGTPWAGASALLAAGVPQQDGVGFDAVLPTTRQPGSVCLVAVPDGTPPPWPTLSCSPVNGDR